MPGESQWTNAIMPGQETSYDGETMDAGFNPVSSRGLASMFNMGTGNIGGGGNSDYGGYNAPAPTPAPMVKNHPNGHYWRGTISNLGVVTWTDLGTTKP